MITGGFYYNSTSIGNTLGIIDYQYYDYVNAPELYVIYN